MVTSVNLFVVLVAASVLIVSFFAYRGTTPSLSRRLRVALTALRVSAFLLIVFLMMDPRFVLRSERTEPARVVALVDASQSMTLPAAGWERGQVPSRFDKAREIARRVQESVESKGAFYTEMYFSGGTLVAGTDTASATGQGTDVRGALGEAFRKYEGQNVAGFVVISDGVDTEERLVRRGVPPVPVYAVGLGDTIAPEDVRIKDVDYNSVVRVPSRSSIRAVLEYQGGRAEEGSAAKRVRITLTENNRTVFEKDTLFTASRREMVREIPVEFNDPGIRRFALRVDVQGRDAQPENNRREIVIEGEKAGEKILILDLVPTWELHFLTALLRRDPTFDFGVVTALGERAAASGGKVVPSRDFAARLKDYDALVIASLKPGFLGATEASAIERFVRQERKGMLVLPGPGSLFEQPAGWPQLNDVLPVQANPPVRFNLKYTTLRPGPQAATHPITLQLVPYLSQAEWQQRAPMLGCYAPLSPKPGAEVLLETAESRAPALVCQEMGGGRVAVLAAGPLWRWKFLAEQSSVYDDFVSRLLDYLSRGGETEKFVLRSAKNVYDSGEPGVVTAEVFDEKMQPMTGVPVRVELSRISGDSDVPLEVISMQREGSDNARFKASLPPLGAGRYRLRGEADLPQRTISSPPLEIDVSDVSVEFQRVSQDRSNLEMIARQSGGSYVGGEHAGALAERMMLEPRVAATSSEKTLRTSLAVFGVIMVLLSVEWIVRKRVGMI